MYGLNANPHGVLADPELRPHINPISTLTYDWVHNCLQDGTFTLEASEFLRVCERHGVISCLFCLVDVFGLGFDYAPAVLRLYSCLQWPVSGLPLVFLFAVARQRSSACVCSGPSAVFRLCS